MPSNKPKISAESFKNLLYPGIFLLYTIALALVFFYFTKFITENLNLAFAPAANQAALERSVQLDLENYSLLATKLRLEMPAAAIITPTTASLATTEQPAAITENASAEATALTTTATEPAPAETAPVTTAPAEIDKASWKIAVINSTARAGLAGELKKRLEAAGYKVIKIGNQTPAESGTIIKLKTGLSASAPALVEINRIISEKYSAAVSDLAATSGYDIEIVIGNH
jgi:hypothetical protein